MERLGVDRPTDISTALGLPQAMARLLAERGEGVLCATRVRPLAVIEKSLESLRRKGDRM